jgi:uncharacterized protein (DUF427 family)
MNRIFPEPGQESVWDYPRPPRAEPCAHRVRVELDGEVVADTTRAWRLLETSHPPAYYIPPEDVQREFLKASPRRSFCEFKGEACYWDIKVGARTSRDAAWCYLSPNQPYSALRGYFAFYPCRVGACFVGEERVHPQTGDFYGGWITSNIVGPFKGGPGTSGW